jgi:hypothetical protein
MNRNCTGSNDRRAQKSESPVCRNSRVFVMPVLSRNGRSLPRRISVTCRGIDRFTTYGGARWLWRSSNRQLVDRVRGQRPNIDHAKAQTFRESPNYGLCDSRFKTACDPIRTVHWSMSRGTWRDDANWKIHGNCTICANCGMNAHCPSSH